MDQARIDREKDFHDERFRGEDSRASASKYYTVMAKAQAKYVSLVTQNCSEKKLLEYGCGDGYSALHWINCGATVTGIDISAEAVNLSKNIVHSQGRTAEFLVMNAEKMDFDDQSFDIVAGTGILHHLELDQSCKEISRVLTPNGHAVFIEPLAHNPIINFYRKLTPVMRTEDEHPLRMSDFNIMKKYFNRVDTYHYNLFTLLCVPFRNSRFFNVLFKLTHGIDQVIFKIPFLKTYSWMVVLKMSQPKTALNRYLHNV